MGASKTSQYSYKEIYSAKVARALAHPARIRILNILKKETVVKNVDLVRDLQLVKSTINSHLYKLLDADLIEFEFHCNSYLIRSKKDSFQTISNYFEEISMC